MPSRQLAKAAGTRLALGTAVAVALVMVMGNPPGHLGMGASARIGAFQHPVRFVETINDPDIPEVDIIGTPDGTLPEPSNFISDVGAPSMAVVTIIGTRLKPPSPPSPPTCTFNSTFNGNLAAMITTNEGIWLHSYLDTRGHPSVGVGFNLDRPGASAALASVGADYSAIRFAHAELTVPQINTLLASDIAAATSRAQHFVPNLSSLRPGQQAVLIDMAFNLGNKLGQFKNMIGAIQAGDFQAAATAMLKSLWAVQVGARASRDYGNLLAC